jgi:hypothetical protein
MTMTFINKLNGRGVYHHFPLSSIFKEEEVYVACMMTKRLDCIDVLEWFIWIYEQIIIIQAKEVLIIPMKVRKDWYFRENLSKNKLSLSPLDFVDLILDYFELFAWRSSTKGSPCLLVALIVGFRVVAPWKVGKAIIHMASIRYYKIATCSKYWTNVSIALYSSVGFV